MKKIFLLNLLIVLVSCSSEFENSSKKGLILPKVLIYKESQSSYTNVVDLVYNGNKIVSVGNKNKRSDYLYDGDKIVKETQYSYELGKEEKVSEVSFMYEKNKLIVSDRMAYGKQFKYFYTYNEDGTITRELQEENDKKDKELKSTIYDVLTFSEGNLTKLISYYKSDTITIIKTTLYKHDNNTNAFKNVLGLNLLLNEVDFYFVGDFGSVNNLSGATVCTLFQSNDSSYDYISSFRYEYNKEGYPIKKICSGMEGTIEIIEYKY